MFSHIKDAANVGTVFVNAISNIMTTVLNDVKLSLKFMDPNATAAIEKTMVGLLPSKSQGGVLTIELGSLRCG